MSSAAELLFQRLLRSLRPLCAASDFRRRSQNFICETPECWGVINFQKSRYSSIDQKSFTINLAIASKRILAYYGKATSAPPPSYACHWAEIRIGSLMPGRRDKWWTLSDEASYSLVESEVKKSLSELAIPLLKPHLTEQGLLELWTSKTPGTFEYPSLKYKSILLALRHEFDALPEIFQLIRGICGGNLAEAGAEEHIAELKKRFSLPA
jgi:hypothetical protein